MERVHCRNYLEHLAFCVATTAVGCGRTGTPDTTSNVAPSAALPADSGAVGGSASGASPPGGGCNVRTKALGHVAWGPDGAILLTGGPTGVEEREPGKPVEDGSIDGWDLAKGDRAFTFHLGAAYAGAYVAFAPDGRSAIASGTSHGAPAPIARWDFQSGATTFASAQISYPEGIEISHDGKLAVVDGGGSNAVVLGLPALTIVHETRNDTAASGWMSFSKDDASIVSDWQGSLSLSSPAGLKTKKAWDGAVGDLSPDEASLAIVMIKGFWGTVDASSGKKLQTFENPPKLSAGPPLSVAYSPDGKRVAVWHGQDNAVSVWQADNGKKLGSGTVTADCRLSWTTDGSVIQCGAQPFDAATMKKLPELPGAPAATLAGSAVLVIKDSRATEIDSATGKLTGRSFDLPGISELAQLEMSPDRAFFAYAREDTGTVRVVRIADRVSLDLGVAWIGGAQKGFASSSEGSFDGPAEAAPCAAKATGPTKPVAGLIRTFFRK